MAYLVEDHFYSEPPSPISSDQASSDSSDEGVENARPSSPTESECSLSLSFSSVATSEFIDYLSDIEFTPSTIPSEMVPPRYWYAIVRGKLPTDLFEELREENVEIERMPSSYLDWVEYGIPLSRFLFTEYWLSRQAIKGWDQEDEREMFAFAQMNETEKRDKLVSEIREVLSKKQDLFERSSPGGMSIWRQPSSLALSSLRFASMEDDRRSAWFFRGNDHEALGSNDKLDDLDEVGSSLESPADSTSSSSREEGESTTTTLAQEYRRRFGGTWNVVQMAGGKIPRYVEEMQAGFMKAILGRGAR
jgi:hypothetical protein